MEETEDQVVAEEQRQFIRFRIADGDYGMELLRVKEVIRCSEATRLPKEPPFVRGIINLRGDVIPILDLRERLGFEPKERTRKTRVIVVETEGRLIGMVADSASQVVQIPVKQIEPPPPTPYHTSQRYIQGVGKLNGAIIILLNIDALLSMDERAALDLLGGTVPELSGVEA